MKKLNIAVMVLDLSGDYTIELFAGITEYFKDKNVNVFITQTKMPRLPYGFYEYQYFAGSRLLQSADVDGVIVVSSFYISTVKVSEFNSFLESFSNKPIISIGQKLPFENSCYTCTDCETTYRKIFDHLVNEHGRKKIAFLSANYTVSQEAKDRYNAYLKINEEFGFPFDEDLIFNGAFTVESGEGEMLRFKDASEVPFDALICANDQMAFGAIKHLLKIGVKIPEQVAVIGFDDLFQCANMEPSLSTINQEIFAQGFKAAELCFKKLHGIEVPKETRIPLKPVYRQSCGCVDINDSETDYRDSKGNLVAKNLHATHSIISKYIESYDERSRIYNLLDVMQDVVSLENLYRKFNYIFPLINMKKVAICLYDDPIVVKNGELFNLPSQVTMTYIFDKEKDVSERTNQRFNPYDQLLPKEVFAYDSTRYVMQAIYYGEKQYGYGFFEVYDVNYQLANIFIKILSNGLANAFEYSRKENEAESLEKTNQELTSTSRTDELTRVLNRRGFMSAGQQALQFAKSIGKTGLVVFCDMDGLKKINDTYGHEIGDKAIQAEAKALKASFRTSDVVGRLGGDEFAIVAIGQTMNNFDRMYNKILHNCRSASAEYDLPHEISLSVGAIPFGSTDMDLQVLLSKADVEQYKEKRRKHAERKE
ncbi:MAG: GGDEF domain-containing protein [Treponema sp.]|nr:GGDEF domain-containing protein [Treponema sp.]